MIMASPPDDTNSEKPPAQKDPSPTAGEVEPAPDSLLSLSDDAIRVVLKYLSPADLSSFEVCVRLRRLITPLWDELLADAEKRTSASRPVPRGIAGSGPNAYCCKLSLMYLLRSVDRAVDVEERTGAGEFSQTNIRYKLYKKFGVCDHIFVRISQKAGNSDGGSYRVAWQGFVSSDSFVSNDWNDTGKIYGGVLTLPEEVSLYDLHPYAKALKDDYKAVRRFEISSEEWKEREGAAFAEARDKTIISIVATRIDRSKKYGAIFSEMITSSCNDGRNQLYNEFIFGMTLSRREGVSGWRKPIYDIVLRCDKNQMRMQLHRQKAPFSSSY